MFSLGSRERHHKHAVELLPGPRHARQLRICNVMNSGTFSTSMLLHRELHDTYAREMLKVLTLPPPPPTLTTTQPYCLARFLESTLSIYKQTLASPLSIPSSDYCA